MEDGRLKIWAKLKYAEPKYFFQSVAPLLNALANSDLSEKFKKFRKSNQKSQRETLQAAIFTRGLSVVLDNPSMEFAMIEDQDHDCVVRHIKDGVVNYTPVQLKELVPVSLIPGPPVRAEVALEAELLKLEKYTDSADLVVAFYLNRTAHFGAIKKPKLKLGGLWAFGAGAQDSSSWLMIGDLLFDSPAIYKFKLLD